MQETYARAAGECKERTRALRVSARTVRVSAGECKERTRALRVSVASIASLSAHSQSDLLIADDVVKVSTCSGMRNTIALLQCKHV